MNLNDFYKKSLETLSLEVNDSAYVTVKSGEEL